jgi:PKD repeat protein
MIPHITTRVVITLLLLISLLIMGASAAETKLTVGEHKFTGGMEVNLDASNSMEYKGPANIAFQASPAFASAPLKKGGPLGIDIFQPKEYEDPVFDYTYNEETRTLKETITMYGPSPIRIPLTLSENSVLIPWNEPGTEWKIINGSKDRNGNYLNTMDGIVSQKPFGIDAKGVTIPMSYSWDGEALNLEYSDPADIVNIPKTTEQWNITGKWDPIYDSIPISYPMVIDPTWMYTGSNWQMLNGTGGVAVMWNSTGTTTWVCPAGVTSINYLVVAGGASGGSFYAAGGGAGGVLAGTMAVTPGATYNVSVGTGGASTNANTHGNNGANSSFGNTTVGDGKNAMGGGYGGGGGVGTASAGGSGGGGGGSSSSQVPGGANVTGQGFYGGFSTQLGAYHSGGGGGAGQQGFNSSTLGAGDGGNGIPSKITWTLTYYAGGGGGATAFSGGSPSNKYGAGGLGGGGDGQNDSHSVSSGSFYGAGGGGGETLSGPSGAGYRGVVIINYSSPVSAGFVATPTSAQTNTLVSFTDNSYIADGSSGIVYNWSFGDAYGTQPFSSQVGSVGHVYTAAGVYDVNLSITASSGASYMLRRQYITIVNKQANTWWSPRQVIFRIVDNTGVPLPASTVNAEVVESTLPGGISGAEQSLISMYGVQSDAAAQMVSNALATQGTTGSDGRISFTMHGSLMYNLTITLSDGSQYVRSLYPLDSDYTIYCPLATQVAPNNTLTSATTSKLPYYKINTSYYNLSMIYYDASGQTSDVVFTIKDYTHGNAVVYTHDLGNPGASIVTDNYTTYIPLGQEYIWSYNATKV